MSSKIERREIFSINLARFPHRLSQEHVLEAASQANNFSGDIIQRYIELTVEAMAMKLRDVTHFKLTEFYDQQCYSPCYEDEIPVENIPSRHLIIPEPFDP